MSALLKLEILFLRSEIPVLFISILVFNELSSVFTVSESASVSIFDFNSVLRSRTTDTVTISSSDEVSKSGIGA